MNIETLEILCYYGFITIRSCAERSPQEARNVADLMHNLPTDITKVRRGQTTALAIVKDLKENSRRFQLQDWLDRMLVNAASKCVE